MAKRKYYEPKDGDQFLLEPECNFRCCDCGLVHHLDIKLLVTVKRDNRATAQVRRHMKKREENHE